MLKRVLSRSRRHQDDRLQGTTAAEPTVAPPKQRTAVAQSALLGNQAGARNAAALAFLQRTPGNASTSSLLAGEEHVSPVLNVVRSAGGRPLDLALRTRMEGSFGHDFGDVRVHTDPQASESALSVSAQAYTVGNHVVFQSGKYAPGTEAGQRILAHELAHVIQQRSGPVDGTPAPGGISISRPSDRFEQAADNAADQVIAGGKVDPFRPSRTAQTQERTRLEVPMVTASAVHDCKDLVCLDQLKAQGRESAASGLDTRHCRDADRATAQSAASLAASVSMRYNARTGIEQDRVMPFADTTTAGWVALPTFHAHPIPTHHSNTKNPTHAQRCNIGKCDYVDLVPNGEQLPTAVAQRPTRSLGNDQDGRLVGVQRSPIMTDPTGPDRTMWQFAMNSTVTILSRGWELWSLLSGERVDDKLAGELMRHNVARSGRPFEVQKWWVMEAPGWRHAYQDLVKRWLDQAGKLAEERYWDGERFGSDLLMLSTTAMPLKSTSPFPDPGAPGNDQFWGANKATLEVSGLVSWQERSGEYDAATTLDIEFDDHKGYFRDRYDWHSTDDPVMFAAQERGAVMPFDVYGWWFIHEEGFSRCLSFPDTSNAGAPLANE